MLLIASRDELGSGGHLFITDDALLNTPRTALVILGAATATAMAIKANMIAYSTTVTPFIFFLKFLLLTMHTSLCCSLLLVLKRRSSFYDIP